MVKNFRNLNASAMVASEKSNHGELIRYFALWLLTSYTLLFQLIPTPDELCHDTKGSNRFSTLDVLI